MKLLWYAGVLAIFTLAVTQKCLDAVKQLLLTRKYNYQSAECILEAIGITMKSNSTNFSNTCFTQIDGASISSPDSGSITDIFGAVYIDKKFMEENQENQTIISGIEMTRSMLARTQLTRSSKK